MSFHEEYTRYERAGFTTLDDMIRASREGVDSKDVETLAAKGLQGQPDKIREILKRMNVREYESYQRAGITDGIDKPVTDIFEEVLWLHESGISGEDAAVLANFGLHGNLNAMITLSVPWSAGGRTSCAYDFTRYAAIIANHLDGNPNDTTEDIDLHHLVDMLSGRANNADMSYHPDQTAQYFASIQRYGNQINPNIVLFIVNHDDMLAQLTTEQHATLSEILKEDKLESARSDTHRWRSQYNAFKHERVAQAYDLIVKGGMDAVRAGPLGAMIDAIEQQDHQMYDKQTMVKHVQEKFERDANAFERYEREITKSPAQ
ncbi:MAG: hypothetical protein ABIH41_04515 [Nanoarchaeota archaeon]